MPISSAYTCLGFANAVLGTNHQRIRDLDAQLAPLLIYDGSLGDLVPDSGRRDDPYFTRLGLLAGIRHSLRTLGRLSWLLLHPSHTDPVSKALSLHVPGER